MRNQSQFTLEGNPNDFTQSVREINDVLSLLAVMTGVDHAKADLTAISVSIEIVADLLSRAYEKLANLTLGEINNETH